MAAGRDAGCGRHALRLRAAWRLWLPFGLRGGLFGAFGAGQGFAEVVAGAAFDLLLFRSKLELGARRRKAVIAGVAVLAGTFVGVVLANPSSKTRRFFTWLAAQMGIVPTILVGLMLAGALYVVFRWLTFTKLGMLLRPRRRGRRARRRGT